MLDELEASRASHRRAWENLQEIRWVLKDTTGVDLLPPARKNRWTGDALIVSGTLTNTSTVTVLITGIDAMGFNQDQKMVSEGSNFHYRPQ